jgi:NAD(P) transhydrogenase subunit alpha
MAQLFVPRERRTGENRVAATPESIKRLIKASFTVVVEPGAGLATGISDEAYATAGATLGDGWSTADVVTTVAPPPPELAGRMKPGSVLIGLLAPHASLELAAALRDAKVAGLAMELIPRITRAQSMDALSSQANVAGYKAVLVGAAQMPKMFPLMMTAAGTVQPARVVILGAGVAGLQAVATARRLGAVVEVSDVRPAVKEQVESLGGKFIDLPVQESGDGTGGYAREVSREFLEKQRMVLQERLSHADLVITTALVPGRPAPRLITAGMVHAMKAGAVIVDMAVEQGGNCELSVRGETVVKHGVTIIGHPNLPSTCAVDASALYARNLQALLLHLAPKGELTLDPKDEIDSAALLTHDGRVVHGPTAERLGAAA